jgi:hypothetical protein
MKLSYTELMQLVEDRMALKLQRIAVIEAKQAEHETRIAAALAADLGPAVAAVRADVDALKTELGAVEA